MFEAARKFLAAFFIFKTEKNRHLVKKQIVELDISFLISTFVYNFWWKMTESQKELLAVFEIRMRDLVALCEEQKCEIKKLTFMLDQEQQEVQHAKQEIQALKIKYANLLTAHVASAEEGDVKNARERLLKLVREVDKCIALLNG